MSIVENMAHLSRLLTDLGDDRLWVNFDPGHLALAGEDPAKWVRTLGPRIAHVHLKDARRIPAGSEMSPVPEGAFRFFTGFEFLPLSKAVARLSELVDALRGVSYRGFLSMEY